MKRRQWMIVMIALIIMSMTIQGCHSRKDIVVGISMPTKTSERWLLDAKYTVSELEAKGYTAKIAFAEDVVGNQAAQIENFIDEGVDVLIVTPIDSKPLNEVLVKAEEREILVIAYDRLIMDMDHIDFYVSFDNEQVGRMQANYIVSHLDFTSGPKFIEFFAGSPDDNNSSMFFEGAMSVLKPYLEAGDLVVASEQYDLKEISTLRWDKMIAKSRMTSLLNLYYQEESVDAVLAPYDGISRGVTEALLENGYSLDTLPIITGQDAELTSIQNIVEGKQSMTVFKDVRLLGKEAAEIVEKTLEGKLDEEYETVYNGKIQVKSLFLQPIKVDKNNWVEVLVDSGYYTKEEITD